MRRIFMIVLVMWCFQPKVSDAAKYNVTNYDSMQIFKSEILRIIKGENLGKNHDFLLKRRCSSVLYEIPKAELAKAKHNHLFQEIPSKEQLEDIKTWVDEANEIFKGQNPRDLKCPIKAFKLWNAYDDKWYAPARQKDLEAYEKGKQKAASQVIDHGKDYLDVSMFNLRAGKSESLFLSIPRDHIISGRFQKDGLKKHVGLGFRYPSMGRHDEGASKYGDKNQIMGILQYIYTLKTFPCYGFKDKKECTYSDFNNSFSVQHTAVHTRGAHGGQPAPYKCLWQKTCLYKDGLNYDVEPEYDEEMQMWRIGNSGFYEGDPEFADYWVMCKKFPKDTPLEQIDRGMCKSAVLIGDKGLFFFEYSFSRRMFWAHREIRDAIKSKFQEFTVPAP